MLRARIGLCLPHDPASSLPLLSADGAAELHATNTDRRRRSVTGAPPPRACPTISLLAKGVTRTSTTPSPEWPAFFSYGSVVACTAPGCRRRAPLHRSSRPLLDRLKRWGGRRQWMDDRWDLGPTQQNFHIGNPRQPYRWAQPVSLTVFARLSDYQCSALRIRHISGGFL